MTPNIDLNMDLNIDNHELDDKTKNCSYFFGCFLVAYFVVLYVLINIYLKIL